jgi:hypothetical protein
MFRTLAEVAMGRQGNDYAKWSEEELRRAQSAANDFLNDNGAQIWANFRSKLDTLNELVETFKDKTTDYDERLESFARMAEIARSLEDDAEGFFRLASEPVVARILRGASLPKR